LSFFPSSNRGFFGQLCGLRLPVNASLQTRFLRSYLNRLLVISSFLNLWSFPLRRLVFSYSGSFYFYRFLGPLFLSLSAAIGVSEVFCAFLFSPIFSLPCGIAGDRLSLSAAVALHETRAYFVSN